MQWGLGGHGAQRQHHLNARGHWVLSPPGKVEGGGKTEKGWRGEGAAGSRGSVKEEQEEEGAGQTHRGEGAAL